jgi:hypothetical protein
LAAAGEHMWATFEAGALPHADRLFRLAMWFEGNRAEAEDLVQETIFVRRLQILSAIAFAIIRRTEEMLEKPFR